jgi:ABC-type polysaccharide/polyol phosphate transport system ATPase subunit
VAEIRLDSVTVDFPIYNAKARSLKNSLVYRGTGGHIGRDAGNRVCVRALENICFQIKHGDRVGLVGGNGAGKTTLLRVLAGVYEPTIGNVFRKGKVASLFDISLGLDPESTGYENIMLRGLFLGLTPRQVHERTEEIADFTELGDYLAMPVRTYSTGMMLRLAFAVCTSISADILLMDEWLTAGDAAFVEKAERRLESLVDRSSILVLASHSVALLKEVCSTAILLDGGRAIIHGSVDDVLGAYRESRA